MGKVRRADWKARKFVAVHHRRLAQFRAGKMGEKRIQKARRNRRGKNGAGSRHAESLRLSCKARPIRKPQSQVQFPVAQDSRQARADGAVEMAEHCRKEGDDWQTPESVDRRGETAERRGVCPEADIRKSPFLRRLSGFRARHSALVRQKQRTRSFRRNGRRAARLRTRQATPRCGDLQRIQCDDSGTVVPHDKRENIRTSCIFVALYNR